MLFCDSVMVSVIIAIECLFSDSVKYLHAVAVIIAIECLLGDSVKYLSVIIAIECLFSDSVKYLYAVSVIITIECLFSNRCLMSLQLYINQKLFFHLWIFYPISIENSVRIHINQ